ncbi:MAG TPA: Hpt domain-containing protein [Xanthobacteraceae bacterium]|nr:Hpt domain-containing protein [Xanthobacteraceae bacterium]
MSNPGKPSIVTYGDYEVITPPHTLRSAVTELPPGAEADDAVARAELALSELSENFPAWMNAECERLEDARAAIHRSGFLPQTRDGLFHAAHDIKGEATTFGFPAVTDIARSLCRLIEHTLEMKDIPRELVDQHVDAIRAIVRESARGDVTDLALALTRRLRDVTEEFLATSNRHRPDYLRDVIQTG